MVVWRLRPPCPIMEHFANFFRRPARAFAAHQCLKPLSSVSEAARRNSIHGDCCVLLAEDSRVPGSRRYHDLGFSIREVTDVFGGMESVRTSCGGCIGNLPSNSEDALQPNNAWRFAGCTQVLLMGKIESFSEQARDLQEMPTPLPGVEWGRFEDSRVHASVRDVVLRIEQSGSLRRLFGANSAVETWQRLWYCGQGSTDWPMPTVEAMAADTRSWFTSSGEVDWSQEPTSPSGWLAFCLAVEIARTRQVPLETQYIPHGFSDGHHWWLGPHCGNCGGELRVDDRVCGICGNQSGPIPVQKRKIMGWAPYRPLAAQLSPEAARRTRDAVTGGPQEIG